MLYIVIPLICILAFILVDIFGTPRDIGAITLISGGVKTGKSALSLKKAYQAYKDNVFKWRIKDIIIVGFTRDWSKHTQKPQFYANIPVGFKHNPLTLDILLRKVRIPNKSVVWVDEASLVADSMDFKDKEINERLMMFCKLFGHYSHGGTLVLNTQSVSDLHYSARRCFGSYQYIHKRKKLPFFTLFLYSERSLVEGEINGATTMAEKDINTEVCKWALVPNKIYKKYDCYAYSYLTDHKPWYIKTIPPIKKRANLKASNIVSVRKLKEVQEYEEAHNNQ